MNTKECYCGAKKSIELLSDDDDSSPEKFVTGLNAKDRKKVDALFELMGERGVISNKEKFKKLEGSDGIFEFKSFQIRLLCFFHGRRVIICRGLIKKKDRHDKSDISYAESCRKKFLGEQLGDVQ